METAISFFLLSKKRNKKLKKTDYQKMHVESEEEQSIDEID